MTGKAGARFWRNWDLARGLFCFLLIKEDITLFSFVIPEMTWTPTVALRSACQVWRGSRAQKPPCGEVRLSHGFLFGRLT